METQQGMLNLLFAVQMFKNSRIIATTTMINNRKRKLRRRVKGKSSKKSTPFNLRLQEDEKAMLYLYILIHTC